MHFEWYRNKVSYVFDNEKKKILKHYIYITNDYTYRNIWQAYECSLKAFYGQRLFEEIVFLVG